jgi:hypothetical protein
MSSPEGQWMMMRRLSSFFTGSRLISPSADIMRTHAVVCVQCTLALPALPLTCPPVQQSSSIEWRSHVYDNTFDGLLSHLMSGQKGVNRMLIANNIFKKLYQCELQDTFPIISP